MHRNHSVVSGNMLNEIQDVGMTRKQDGSSNQYNSIYMASLSLENKC